jgi:hypothetical protein
VRARILRRCCAAPPTRRRRFNHSGFIAVIGYSFAKVGDAYDDGVSLDWFKRRFRNFGGPIYVINPWPDELQTEMAPPDSPSRRFRAIFDMMQRLDLTDNERAILIMALRRLVDFDPLSPQTQALKAILERLEPQKPQPIPDTAGTG